MYVSSYLELHTTLIGWMLYGLSYDLLMQTGLFLLPFLWMLLSDSAKHIREADSLDNESHAGTRSHIFSLLGGLVVIATCLMPVYVIQPTTVTYQPPPSFSDPDPAEVTADADPSTYGQALDPVIGAGAVRVPIWWRFLQGVSTGVTQAIVQNLPTPGDLRQVRVALSSTNISDPAIAHEYRNFVSHCFRPAHRQFERMVREGSINPDGVAPEDIDWPGSRYLMELPGGYRYCSAEARTTHGCYRSIEPDRTGAAYLGENATCADWWTAIEDKLIALDAPNDKRWRNIRGTNAALAGLSAAEVRETRVRRILNNYAAAGGAQVAAEHSSGEQGVVGKAVGVAQDLLAAGVLASKAVATETTLRVMKQAVPMVVAILQMFLVIILPWAMLFTAYRISAIVSLSFLLFSLTFVHALLAIAGWLDYYLTVSLFDDFTLNQWLQGDDGHTLGTAQKGMLINIILAFTYIGVPVLWLATMNIAGLQAGRGAGNLLNVGAGPAGQAAGSVGGTAGKLVDAPAKAAGKATVGGVKGAAVSAAKYRF